MVLHRENFLRACCSSRTRALAHTWAQCRVRVTATKDGEDLHFQLATIGEVTTT